MNFVETVEAIAMNLRIGKYAEMDSLNECVEFFTLRSEIAKKLEKTDATKIPVFYILAEVYCEINKLYTPVDAFIAGMIANAINKDYRTGYDEFVREIDAKVLTSDLSKRQQELLTDVKKALGENCKLITKFFEQHTKNTAIEVFCLETFYEHGYKTPIVKDDENKSINSKLFVDLQKAGAKDLLFKSRQGYPFDLEE